LLCLCKWGTSFPFIICLCTSQQVAGRRHRHPSSSLGQDNSPGQLSVAPKGSLHCNCTWDTRSVSFCASPQGVGGDTNSPAEPSAKTIHVASSDSAQLLLCFVSEPGEPGFRPTSSTLGQDNSPGQLPVTPSSACIATAPGTLVLFHSVHVAEGLSADTDHPAEPSAKTIYGESSGSAQVMICFASATWELRSLSFYAYVQVHKGLGADTDRPAQP